ncbi:hypothetical protein [Roseibium sp.]|uniref:hypothetical protein n=1 Tax=Roseibium sp. TaxID=1936156 RepID=UPI003513F476
MAMIISSARAAPADTASKKEKATQQIREIDTTTTPNNQRIKVVTQFHQILSLVLLQYRKLYPARTNPSSLTENSCHTRALLAQQATTPLYQGRTPVNAWLLLPGLPCCVAKNRLEGGNLIQVKSGNPGRDWR